MQNNKPKKLKLKFKFKLLITLLTVIIYSIFIGTKGIVTKDYKIKSNKINDETHGLKILQFSDLNYGSSVNERALDNLVKKINLAKPDIILFSGDLIYYNYNLSKEEQSMMIKKLSKLTSEYGNYYINGEDDNDKSISILNSSNFISLEDSEQLIYKSNKSPILLTSKEKAKTFFEINDSFDGYKILLLHNPDDYDGLKQYNFDLVLAGHTMNGLIGIPKLKDLYINSKYKNTYQKIDNTKLYVNSGIGTKKIKVRLFNRPSIYLFRLNKAS